MGYATRLLTAVAVGGLIVIGTPISTAAQITGPAPTPRDRSTPRQAPGSISGIVQDEKGTPLPGVVVSAVGATTFFAVTDRTGRFSLESLTPGPYFLRASLTGYAAPRARTLHVGPSASVSSGITLHRAGTSAPILAAGLGGAGSDARVESNSDAEGSDATEDDHSETAWRIRHARRGVLKTSTMAELVEADDEKRGALTDVLAPLDVVGRAIGPPARAATNFFADTPFSGQVNLLTAGAFDTPQQLFSSASRARNIAHLHVGAPVGEYGDWAVRGAVTQADISAWMVAGSYTVRVPSGQSYDVGLSYSTQQYDGGIHWRCATYRKALATPGPSTDLRR